MKNSNLKNKKRILFSANLGFLYKEKIGFLIISITELNVLSKTRLPLISINTNPGNIKKEFFGFSALPQYIEKAQFEIRRSIEYGINIGIKNLHVMAGNTKINTPKKLL